MPATLVTGCVLHVSVQLIGAFRQRPLSSLPACDKVEQIDGRHHTKHHLLQAGRAVSQVCRNSNSSQVKQTNIKNRTKKGHIVFGCVKFALRIKPEVRSNKIKTKTTFCYCTVSYYTCSVLAVKIWGICILPLFQTAFYFYSPHFYTNICAKYFLYVKSKITFVFKR